MVVPFTIRGGWDKCLGPFSHQEAESHGIDDWECHSNCYTRRDVNGGKLSCLLPLCPLTQPHIKSKKRLTAIHLISSYTLLLAIVNTSWLVVYCIRFLLNVPTIDNALYTYTYDLNDWVGY